MTPVAHTASPFYHDVCNFTRWHVDVSGKILLDTWQHFFTYCIRDENGISGYGDA